MSKKAFAVLEIRATGERDGKRTFSGIATTPETDSYGDIVDPQGAEFKLPMPLLWQHDRGDPIGWVTAARASKKGIEIDAEVANIPDPGELKERLDKAWQYLKNKLVRGLSIGFMPIESARIEGTYGMHFTKWKWLELSTVTIGANEPATITAIKSADAALRTPSGRGASDSNARASAPSGNQSTPLGHRSSITMKTLQELIDDRTAKQARASELRELINTEKRNFTGAEATEFDTLTDDLEALEQEIRLKRFDDRMASNASAVNKGAAADQRASRGPTIHVKQDPDPDFKGQAATRYFICKAIAWLQMKQGNIVSPVDVAKHRYGQRWPGQVKMMEAAYQRAAVAGGGTGSGEWGAELAQSDTQFSGDFIEFLYGATVFDRIGLRDVPARIHIKGQDGEATGFWVGESKAIKVSKPDYSDVELSDMKVGAIAVCSKDLVFASTPSAEALIRDSLVQASAKRIDTTVFSTDAISAGVSPAGLGNGLSAAAPSGADAAAVRADLLTLYSGFLTAKNAGGLVQVMTPGMAKAISLLVNANGVKEFPDLRSSGGTLEGDPVFTGDNIAGGDWWLLKPSDVWKIGDRGVEVSMSDSVTIEQDSAPAGASDTPTAASATLMSMWQTESVAFKVVRHCNVQKRRSTAVALLQNAEYGGVIS